MTSLNKVCAALAVAVLLPLAKASSQTPMSVADSINSATADLVTANVQQGISMVLAQTRELGLEVDSALLVEQVAQRIREPYNEARHRAAAKYLSESSQRILSARNAQFLEAAKGRPGAQELEGGVILETFQPGVGPTVQPTDTVVFHYRGSLPDGTVFDDTTGGEPLTSVANRLVPGMITGLGYMNAGGRYRLTIPSDKAYGSRGAGGVIPPDTPIEFTIEIVEINN